MADGRFNYLEGKGSAFILDAQKASDLSTLGKGIAQKKAESTTTDEEVIKALKNPNYKVANKDFNDLGDRVNELRNFTSEGLKEDNLSMKYKDRPDTDTSRKEHRVDRRAKKSAGRITDPTSDRGRELLAKKEALRVFSLSSTQGKANYDENRDAIFKNKTKYTDYEGALKELDRQYREHDTDSGPFQYKPKSSFDTKAYLDDFSKGLIDETTSVVEKRGIGGSLLEAKTVTSQFLEVDPTTGQVVMDENGNPKLKINDNTVGLALQNPNYARSIELKMEEPESKGKTKKQLVVEDLALHQKIDETTKTTKGFAYKSPKSKTGTYGPGELDNSSEDNLLKTLSKLTLHDDAVISKGKPVSITYDGSKKNFLSVPSLLQNKTLGKDVVVHDVLVDPNDKNGFYIMDSSGKISKYDNSNLYDIISVLTENKGEYDRGRIDALLKERNAISDQGINTRVFYKGKSADKEQYSNLEVLNVIDNLPTTGSMFKSVGGTEKLEEVLSNKSLTINGKTYSGITVEPTFSGKKLTLKDGNGNILLKDISVQDLKKELSKPGVLGSGSTKPKSSGSKWDKNKRK